MKKAKGHACGKCILLGEHFVVGGAPAIAFPLPELECEVTVSPDSHPHYAAKFPGDDDIELVETVMARALYAAADSLRLDMAAQPFRIESQANFPVSRGFGSSAAFAIALARALASYRDAIGPEKTDLAELIKAVGAVEKIFHGQPSGVDAAVIFAEHMIRFERGSIVREVTNNAVDLVVVDGGSRDNSGSLIKKVQDFRTSNPDQWARMSASVTELVDACEQALLEGDAEGVASTVIRSQAILSDLRLSTPMVDTIIKKAAAHGALAGKVSGAGGGGAVIIVARPGEGLTIAGRLSEDGYRIASIVQPAQSGSGAGHGAQK